MYVVKPTFVVFAAAAADKRASQGVGDETQSARSSVQDQEGSSLLRLMRTPTHVSS